MHLLERAISSLLLCGGIRGRFRRESRYKSRYRVSTRHGDTADTPSQQRGHREPVLAEGNALTPHQGARREFSCENFQLRGGFFVGTPLTTADLTHLLRLIAHPEPQMFGAVLSLGKMDVEWFAPPEPLGRAPPWEFSVCISTHS